MQSEVEKLEALQLKVWNNINRIVDEIKAGQWQIIYDKDVDEFYWSNLQSSPNGNSAILPVDKCFSVSINKETGAIEYLRIVYFDTVFVKENPELKKFAKLVMKNNTDRHSPLELLQGLIGRLTTTGTANKIKIATTAASV
jgi:hypothetical protein